MSGRTIANSAEFLFWNSNYSRIMNFHDSSVERRAGASRDASRPPLHPDVYFHLHFVPFIIGSAATA